MSITHRLLIGLCSGALTCAAANAQNNAVIRGPAPSSGGAAAKSPVPTRDTIRPMTKAGALIAGQPETPGSTRVSYYCHQYDQAMRGMVQTSSAYSDKRGACVARAFTAQEQAAAGCQQTDTVAACSEKLVAWCAGAELKSYRASVGEVVAATRRLSKEAAVEADNRAALFRMKN